jgi:endonuclease G
MTPVIGALSFIIIVLFGFSATANDAAECSNMLAPVGAPAYKGAEPEHELLCRSGYVLSHNNERLTPDWVVELLTPDRFTGNADRKSLGNPFKADPDLEANERATPADYVKSGYDKGHMAPAADMKFSDEAMKESFYLSNMIPQIGPGMNLGIWADLEALVRDWTCNKGQIVALTGPIYDDAKPKMIPVGNPRVAVPTAIYKIAYSPSEGKAVAFILPNKAVANHSSRAEEILSDYVVSVRDVETRTGLNFFTALPPRKQNIVEMSKTAPWKRGGGCKNVGKPVG